MQVATEEFAEGGLFAARGAVASVLADRFDVGLVEAHILVSAEREDAAQRAIERPDREILHLAALGRARLGDDGGEGQHAEPHMPRLVLQDAAADLAEHRIFRRLGQHAEQRHREGLGNQLQPDRLQIPGRGAEQGVEDFLDVAGERIGLAVEPQRDVAMQYLVVARLVDDLAGLEQLGVLPDHILDHLAAHQHRAVLAVHQCRDAPPRHEAVDLDPLRR